jgi:uncharacterized protein (DUF736 family)
VKNDIATFLSGQTSDPVFGLRVVFPDGREASLLSAEMKIQEQNGRSVYSAPDFPVSVTIEFKASALTAHVANAGSDQLEVDFYAPIVSRLAEGEFTAYIPQVGGITIPVKDANYLQHNSGQLASLFMILQAEKGGIALGHEKSAEDEGRYRSGIMVHRQGVVLGQHKAQVSDQVGSAIKVKLAEPACDAGGVACFTENFILHATESLKLGPYLILAYEGGEWTKGAALLREHRYPRKYRPRPKWFRDIHNCAEICCTQHFDELVHIRREQIKWGTPLVSINYFFETHSKMTWGSSFRQQGGAKKYGGDEALFKAIDDLHREGSKVLFYVTPWSLTIGYDQAQVCMDNKWHMQEFPGDDASPLLDYGEFGKFVCPCPGHAPARKWVVDGIVETLKKYPIDGFFFDEAAAILNRPCYNPAHNHDNPYVWTYGNYEVFRDLRAAMDEVNPDTLIISEGGSELYREFIDGCIAHTDGWSLGRHSVPLTRAVVPEVAIFDSVTGIPANMAAEAAVNEKRFIRDSEHMLGIQFVGGTPYYINGCHSGRLSRFWVEHEEYRRAFPEMFRGDIEAEIPEFSTNSVIGYLIRDGERLILTAANVSRGGIQAPVTVTLPVAAKGIYDRVKYQYFEVRDGKATFRMSGGDVRAFEVVTG